MIKKLVPSDFKIPESLETDKFRLRMLTANDVDKDYEAIMSSIKHLKKTPTPPMCGDWPPYNLSKAKDLEDLKYHEEQHLNRESFTYTVMNLEESKCLGCVYILPSTKTNFDAEIYLWVREDEAMKGLDEYLFNTIKTWMKDKWPFGKVVYPGRSINSKIKLAKPTEKYEKSWKEAIAEFEAEGRIGFWNSLEKPDDLNHYIKRTRDLEEGKNLPEGYVPATTYWLVDNDKFIGHTSIRHKLTEPLKKFGGHIGYAIRPTARKMGYGTKILELALPKAKSLGLKKVLITCDESNTASQKIIEKNKGVFQDKISGKDEPTLRYWITI